MLLIVEEMHRLHVNNWKNYPWNAYMYHGTELEEANDNLIMLKYFLQEEGDENWEKYCEAIDTLLTAYEKEKEKNIELKLEVSDLKWKYSKF